MKGYIISICLSCIIVTLADTISPKEHQKYIRILLGFLVLSVILSPLPAVKKIRLEPLKSQTMDNSELFSDGISKKLKENVELDICERLKGEFGISCNAEVLLEIDGEHKIRGVKMIALSKKIPENAVDRLKQVYGCERIEYKIK